MQMCGCIRVVNKPWESCMAKTDVWKMSVGKERLLSLKNIDSEEAGLGGAQ